MQRGKYIVLEGIEAGGKSTIVQMLARQLAAAQLPVQVIAESADATTAAQSVSQLLQDPRYPVHTAAEALLYNAAHPPSLDIIRRSVASGTVCLADHSYLADLVTGYYGRGDITDYAAINQIVNFAVADVQPDVIIVIDAPIDVIAERIRARGSTQPVDESYLERVRAGYLWEARQRTLPVVYNTGTIDEAFAQVWKYVSQALGIRSSRPSQSKPQSIAQVLAEKPLTKAAAAVAAPATPSKSALAANAAPRPAKAAPAVQATQKPRGAMTFGQLATNADGPVYGFTREISSFTLSQALGQLNYSGDSLRTHTVPSASEQTNVTGRVAQKYLHQPFVVEKSSSRLSEQFTEQAHAICLRQPATQITPDQKDANGHYPYYIPGTLRGKVRSTYIRSLNQLYDTYAQIVMQLTTYIRTSSVIPRAQRDAAWEALTEAQARTALHPLLPLATTETVILQMTPDAIEDSISSLLQTDSIEAQTTAKLLLREAQKANPSLLKHVDTTIAERSEAPQTPAVARTTQKLANELLPANHTAEAPRVTLTAHTPRNELDIVSAILYPLSDLPAKALQAEVLGWPYQRKLDVLMAHVSERPHKPATGQALEIMNYSFDILCSYAVFQRFSSGAIKTRQALTPRLGYDTPQLVDDAGLSDAYADCFDLSLELYSALQAGNYPNEAEYAVLHGHKVRWCVRLTAPQIARLCMHTPANAELKQLIGTMYDKLAEVHPLVAETIAFARQHKRS